MPPYVRQKRNAYFVRLDVPSRLRPVIGKRELWRPLKTTDRRTANDRSHAVVAELKAILRAAEQGREVTPVASLSSPESHLLRSVADLRERAEWDEETGHPSNQAAVNLDATVEHFDGRMAPLVARVAAGHTVVLLSDQIDTYLGELRGHVREQTWHDKVRVYDAFTDWLRMARDVRSITRQEAGAYVSNVIAVADKAPKTKQHELAHLSALWRWMLGRGVVESNIWSLMTKTIASNKRGGVKTERRPWSTLELLTLFRGTDQGDPLWSVAALSLYSALRVEELCALEVTDVRDNAFHINEAKSVAGVRSVPIHAVVAPLVSALLKQTWDGYLVPGLLISGRDHKRSVLFSKRFSYHLREILKITNPDVVFHGLRHTFINTMEDIGVPESTAKLIVGHSRGDSITYGTKGKSYSQGLSLERLRGEVAKITHGTEVDALVAEAAPTIQITHRSIARPDAKRTSGKHSRARKPPAIT